MKNIDFFTKEVEYMTSLVDNIEDEPMRELLGLIIHNCAMSEKEMSDRLEKLEKQAAHLMWGKHFSFD